MLIVQIIILQNNQINKLPWHATSSRWAVCHRTHPIRWTWEGEEKNGRTGQTGSGPCSENDPREGRRHRLPGTEIINVWRWDKSVTCSISRFFMWMMDSSCENKSVKPLGTPENCISISFKKKVVWIPPKSTLLAAFGFVFPVPIERMHPRVSAVSPWNIKIASKLFLNFIPSFQNSFWRCRFPRTIPCLDC